MAIFTYLEGRPAMVHESHILALLKSHINHDSQHFLATAMEVASAEARRGNRELAEEIASYIKQARHREIASRQKIPVELTDVITEEHTRARLSDLILPPQLRERLARVLLEYSRRSELAEIGLPARRKLLLVGPPGTGKTATATALAGELNLPLYRVVMARLLSRFMGETGNKLTQVFSHMRSSRGVYLFDELDAIAAERQYTNDVGEMRRVLNTFLVALELDRSSSVIVAASNLPTMLDSALFRRFDDLLTFELPSESEIYMLLRYRLREFPVKSTNLKNVAKLAVGMSSADIIRAAEDSAKDYFLSQQDEISTESLEANIVARRIE